MSKEYKLFDPKTLASGKILDFKLKNIEIHQDKKDEDVEYEEYIIDFIFENIFGIDEYSDKVEKYFDDIFYTLINECGLYLESIQIGNQEDILAWGIIHKKDDKYYVCKPDNIE